MLHVQCGSQDRAQAVIVDMRDWIVAMRMALRTANGQTQKRARYDLDRFCDCVVAASLAFPASPVPSGHESQIGGGH